MIMPIVALVVFFWCFAMMCYEIWSERKFPSFSFKYVVLFGLGALYFLTH